MTAVSPYAPPRRNSHMHPPLARRQSSGVGTAAASSMGFLLWVLRYWKDAPVLNRIRDSLNKVIPEGSPLRTWIQVVTSRLPRITAGPSSSLATTTTSSHLEKVQRNNRRIQEVLKYWFGQYSPDGSQKKLWMIANSSTALRDQVDAEIVDRFAQILIDLSQEDDDNNNNWREWCQQQDFYSYQGKLAAIIVLDQFSRHIHRFKSANSHDVRLNGLPEQSQLDKLALQVAEALQENHADEIKSGMIPLPMYIFALMPYRHASRTETVQFVQTQVEASEDLLNQNEGMLRRFRKATNRRMAVLQDNARTLGDPSKSEYTDEDILEVFPFEGDLSQVHKHPIYETICKFLAERGIRQGDRDAQPRPIIVSLSGGVDSMVIASVLSHLKRFGNYNLQIVAVHIDYGNRPEAHAEAAFVKRYCDMLEIDFRCRSIEEVSRGVTARDDYERIAREIRFRTYHEAVQDCLSDKEHPDSIEVGVMLGHHRGDLRENVLSNAHKGCGPLDLSGMTAVSHNDGIALYRPLLPLEKTFVFDYAHTFGVPYFKDTTPHWSTRGKLRNKLLPLLQEIYGEGSMNNLSSLAVESDECRMLLHDVALKPFLDRITYRPMGLFFETAPWKSQGLSFWKFVIREALHSAGIGMLTDKSVVSFLERIQSEHVKEGWMQCRKDCAFFLRRDGVVFVFYPECFPWRKSDFYSLPDSAGFGEDRCTQVGPWEIRVERVDQDLGIEDNSKLLQQCAVPSMEELMQGYIIYYLEVPKAAQELAFRKFVKSNRPRSWKGVDVKIQDTLPIVGKGEDSSSLDDSVEGEATTLAKVTISLRILNSRRPTSQ